MACYLKINPYSWHLAAITLGGYCLRVCVNTLEVQRKPPMQWFHPVLSHSSKVFVSKTANSVILLLLNHSPKGQGNKTWRLIVMAFLPQNGR